MIDERQETQGNIFGNNEGFGALFDDLEESRADGFADLGWSQKSNRVQAVKASSGNSEFRDDSLSRNLNRMDEELIDQVYPLKTGKEDQRKTIFPAIERAEVAKNPLAETRTSADAAEFRSSFVANIPRMTSIALQPSLAPKQTVDPPKATTITTKQPAFAARNQPQTLVCLKPLQNQPTNPLKDQNQTSEPKNHTSAITIGLKYQPPKLETSFPKIQGVSLMNIHKTAGDNPANPMAKQELFKTNMPALSNGAPPLKQLQTLMNFASKLLPVTSCSTAVHKEFPGATKPVEATNAAPVSAKLIKSNTGSTFAIPPGKPPTSFVPSLAAAGKTANNQPHAEGIGS